MSIPLASIKDMASVATPIVLAVAGWIINKSLQRQNKAADRRSAMTTQWANDFALAVHGINEFATRVLFAHFKLSYLEKIPTLHNEATAYAQEINLQRPEWHVQLLKRGYEMSLFQDLSPRYGENLKQSFDSLNSVVYDCIVHRGCNPDEFRKVHADFNRHAREVHKELLQWDD